MQRAELRKEVFLMTKKEKKIWRRKHARNNTNNTNEEKENWGKKEYEYMTEKVKYGLAKIDKKYKGICEKGQENSEGKEK